MINLMSLFHIVRTLGSQSQIKGPAFYWMRYIECSCFHKSLWKYNKIESSQHSFNQNKTYKIEWQKDHSSFLMGENNQKDNKNNFHQAITPKVESHIFVQLRWGHLMGFFKPFFINKLRILKTFSFVHPSLNDKVKGKKSNNAIPMKIKNFKNQPKRNQCQNSKSIRIEANRCQEFNFELFKFRYINHFLSSVIPVIIADFLENIKFERGKLLNSQITRYQEELKKGILRGFLPTLWKYNRNLLNNGATNYEPR